MREIVLDTETTGFEPHEGDRIVEIGAVELIGHVPTGRTYHQYINPMRSMPEGAFGVHGIGPDLLEPPRAAENGEVTLRDKPVFADIAQSFLDFVGDAKMVIHNAAFDMKFLNAELGWLNRSQFAIDNSNRTLHGALLDSEILAEVYLELIGGRQPDFGLGAAASKSSSTAIASDDWRPQQRPTPLSPRITKEEAAAHHAFIESLGDGVLWNCD